MPNIELIPSIENREFTTGLGNWVGFDGWEAGPILGRYGLAVTELPSGTVEKNISLSYPAFNSPKNSTLTLYMIYKILPIAPVFILLTFSFKDATHNLIGWQTSGSLPDGWIWVTNIYNTPSDWDRLTAIIGLKWYKVSPLAKTCYHDNFSLKMWVPARVDHLPIMGVH